MATVTPPPALPPAARSIRRHVVWNASIVALGGLLFGYDTGVISGALLFIGKDFAEMSSAEKELLTSILLIGAVVGALFAGRIGRRPTVLATAAIFVVGVLLAAFSPSYEVLLVARVVIGLTVGSSSMVVPLYIGETAPPRIRGALVSFNQLAITLGILISYLADYGLASSQNWRLMFGLATIPAVLLFVGMLFQRESPHWLIAQGREEQARSVLERIRRQRHRRRDHPGAGAVFAHLQRLRPAQPEGPPRLDDRHRLGGLPADHRHQHDHLLRTDAAANAGLGDSAALLANVVNGGVNVAMTIVAILLLDRAGRRPLLLTGTTGMAVGMAMLALTFLIGGSNLHDAYAYVAIAGLLVYTGSFAIGLGPVFWLLISEIYPVKIRGQAMSVATIANWGANFVVTVSFLTLLSVLGDAGTFFLFGALTLIALVYFYRQVPETKNRTLPEIERDLGLPHGAMSDPEHPSKA